MLLEAVLHKKPISLVTKYSPLKVFKSAEYAVIITYLNTPTKWWFVCMFDEWVRSLYTDVKYPRHKLKSYFVTYITLASLSFLKKQVAEVRTSAAINFFCVWPLIADPVFLNKNSDT